MTQTMRPVREEREGLGLDLRGRSALVAVLMGVALATLDTAIANVALPTIASDLQSSAASAIWIVNAYQLAMVATILPFAALGDGIGPRRVFISGLALFTTASGLCMAGSSITLLAAARAFQGIGAGAMMSVNIALIREIYPPARLRGVGLNALMMGIVSQRGLRSPRCCCRWPVGPGCSASMCHWGCWPSPALGRHCPRARRGRMASTLPPLP
jgi:DHA2 family multidrug resistance protein-like MFS transporter